MNTHTIAQHLLAELPLSELDVARLFIESIEHIGHLTEGKSRLEIIMMMRRMIRIGAESLNAESNTVSLKCAVLASVHARRHLRPVSRRDLRFFARRFISVESLADVPLNKITPKQCRILLEKSFGNNNSLYCKARTILHSVFVYGMQHEWCTNNPVKCLSVPKISERRITPLTLAEIGRLKKTVQRPEFSNMKLSLLLLLYCGIRPAEVARLREEDICWREKQVIIHPTTSKTGGGRVVPIRCSLAGIAPHERVIPRNWNQRWQKLRRAAGFRRWQADSCRHTFASYHAAYFHNLNELQMEMGHRSVDLLRTRYVVAAKPGVAARFWKTAKFE